MLIRFATLAQDPDSGHASGILVAASTLRDEGPLTKAEHEDLRLLLCWFNENVPVPGVLAKTGHRRALSWFKPSAKEAIQKMWILKHLLAYHGFHINVLHTKAPGSILYQDALQVVAKPSKGVRF